MNVYPYTSGHLMVAPLRHEADLADLDHDEADALMAMTQDAHRGASTRAYAPDGINVGVNLGRAAGAGVPGHLHVHVAAALERRHQLHDHGRRGPGAARAARPSYEKLASAAWARVASHRDRGDVTTPTRRAEGDDPPRGPRRHRVRRPVPVPEHRAGAGSPATIYLVLARAVRVAGWLVSRATAGSSPPRSSSR